jgi:hypothetical protein
MGTNYYVKTGRKHMVECYACGRKHREAETFHIGKSSCGRYFTLHAIPEKGLLDFASWKNFLEAVMKEPGAKIEDEYGRPVELEQMEKLITREDYPVRDGDWVEGEAANEWGDIFGKKGLVYSEGRETYPDGLYIMLAGEFS